MLFFLELMNIYVVSVDFSYYDTNNSKMHLQSNEYGIFSISVETISALM